MNKKKSEGRKRADALMIMLTEAEKAEVVRAAEAKGMTMSTYARTLLLSNARSGV